MKFIGMIMVILCVTATNGKPKNRRTSVGIAIAVDKSESLANAESRAQEVHFFQELIGFLINLEDSDFFEKYFIEMVMLPFDHDVNVKNVDAFYFQDYKDAKDLRKHEGKALTEFINIIDGPGSSEGTDLANVINFVTANVPFSALPAGSADRSRFLFLVSDFIDHENLNNVEPAIQRAHDQRYDVVAVPLNTTRDAELIAKFQAEFHSVIDLAERVDSASFENVFDTIIE